MANTLKDWARAIKRDVHAIYLAARDPRVPWYAKALALCVAGYALSPIDLIPDFIPVLGYLDDLIIVPLGIVAVMKLIPPEIMAEHRAAAAIAAERPISRTAAGVILLIWIAPMRWSGGLPIAIGSAEIQTETTLCRRASLVAVLQTSGLSGPGRNDGQRLVRLLRARYPGFRPSFVAPRPELGSRRSPFCTRLAAALSS